ncbi:uncharacterized protein [Gossypium hirsutum]|uniref:Uncharacterized protein n=1 Tax=Gossypium hirsutum TaxID=3635 RepID=A0A1U8P7Q9_GOSHI|nr:uncharacterized protein LOC107955892 [Gossypium hirsutum]
MNDLDCTLEQKLKGAMSLLRDEAYKWWLTVNEGASYVDACKHEFLNLTQGDRSVAKYEVKFLRLSHYARGIVASEYERCVRFEDGKKDNLRVLIAPQRECEFAILVKKEKTAEDVKCTECYNKDREKSKNKRDSEPLSGLRKRRQPSECWRRIGAYLRCGSPEHRIRECMLRADQVSTPISGPA